MKETTPNQNESSREAPRRSIVGDAKAIRDSLRGGAEKCPAQPPRFSLPKALALFWGYALIVYAGVLALFNASVHEYPLRAALIAALAAFLSGNLSILCAFFGKKKFGALAELLVTSAVRTGLPLAVALAFYFAADRMIARLAVLTLAALYLLTLAFEVWVTLPGRSAGIGDGNPLTQDES